MTELQRNEIHEIVDSILSNVPALEIYLFGSFAKGEEREGSDYDLYVVIPDDIDMREREADWAIRHGLSGKHKKNIDMLVGTQRKFNRRKNYFYSIENEIIETGVKLYG